MKAVFAKGSVEDMIGMHRILSFKAALVALLLFIDSPFERTVSRYKSSSAMIRAGQNLSRVVDLSRDARRQLLLVFFRLLKLVLIAIGGLGVIIEMKGRTVATGPPL